MQKFHIYIHFPEEIDGVFDEVNNISGILKDFLMTINLADCEKGSQLYYSKSNKDLFFENCNTINELIESDIGIYDKETVINILLQGSDIVSVKEELETRYIITSYNSRKPNTDIKLPKFVNDVVLRNDFLNESDKQLVLNLFGGYISQNPILIIVDRNENVSTINLPYVTNFKELDDWLKLNRLTRNFNNTDTRHIENTPNYRREKSPLLGGIGGRQNAEELLYSAIGDKRSSSNKYDLMNFDSDKGEYIWYEYENDTPQNQYHAYHLVEPETHNRDEPAIKRIPKRVIEILEYRNI